MIRKLFLLFSFWYFASLSFASTVDTISVYSSSMNKNIKAVVVLPDNYNKAKQLPVVYILHGYGDNYSKWINKVPYLTKTADLYQFIIVMPDGSKNSWYWDSPVDTLSCYETFISNELIKHIDSNYKTIKSREGRAITGNSMGGQGALFLAFRHQDVFSAAGSLSGGVDIRPFPLNWDMADKLGAFSKFPERWNEYSIINQVWRLTPGSLHLIIDCGTDDFFYHVNETFHKKLLERNIPHVFIENRGNHNWKYWSEEIDYQLLFFSKHLLNDNTESL